MFAWVCRSHAGAWTCAESSSPLTSKQPVSHSTVLAHTPLRHWNTARKQVHRRGNASTHICMYVQPPLPVCTRAHSLHTDTTYLHTHNRTAALPQTQQSGLQAAGSADRSWQQRTHRHNAHSPSGRTCHHNTASISPSGSQRRFQREVCEGAQRHS